MCVCAYSSCEQLHPTLCSFTPSVPQITVKSEPWGQRSWAAPVAADGLEVPQVLWSLKFSRAVWEGFVRVERRVGAWVWWTGTSG